MAKQFKVVSLGNIMGECGYEVNDAHYTGDVIELEDTQLPTIMRALKECGQMSKHVTRQSVYIDHEAGGETSIFLRAKGKQRRGLWLWELQDVELLEQYAAAAKRRNEEQFSSDRLADAVAFDKQTTGESPV